MQSEFEMVCGRVVRGFKNSSLQKWNRGNQMTDWNRAESIMRGLAKDGFIETADRRLALWDGQCRLQAPAKDGAVSRAETRPRGA